MTARQLTLELTLPGSSDDLGRWLEDHGGNIEIGCSLGQYNVTVSWSKLHSYSDDDGLHRESWEVSRHGKDLPSTIASALEAAMRKAAT